MNLNEVFERTRAQNRAALVAYLPAGFPDLDTSSAALTAMVEAGVDIVEIGLPYSDPVIDGPTVATAAQLALDAGTRTTDVFEVVRRVAATSAPAVLMTYWNPVERWGVDRFARELAQAGGVGMITPDLIPDEAAQWISASNTHGLDRIFLVAPSSTDARLAMTADAATGFIYATAVMGVTGQRAQTSSLAEPLVARLRAVTDKPVGVGLGISNGAQAHEVAQFADAVIVGSAFVRRILDAPDRRTAIAEVAELAGELRRGVERS